VHEHYSPPRCPLAWDLVYETISGIPAGSNGGVQIRDAIADMMDAGATLRQKSAHRTIRLNRSQQLDLGFAKWECQNGGTVGYFRWMGLDPEHIPVKGECRFQVFNGYTDMSNTGTVDHRFLPGN
jgi:hypothetical protein